ncbi:hypothetical protein QBC45DRAFT_457491 [Copromyces sp. CBS 386.78]|nr:hypothetical protein QBC45DRAFT_457491 [Copromyces sp. CBS 386.78]
MGLEQTFCLASKAGICRRYSDQQRSPNPSTPSTTHIQILATRKLSSVLVAALSVVSVAGHGGHGGHSNEEENGPEGEQADSAAEKKAGDEVEESGSERGGVGGVGGLGDGDGRDDGLAQAAWPGTRKEPQTSGVGSETEKLALRETVPTAPSSGQRPKQLHLPFGIAAGFGLPSKRHRQPNESRLQALQTLPDNHQTASLSQCLGPICRSTLVQLQLPRYMTGLLSTAYLSAVLHETSPRSTIQLVVEFLKYTSTGLGITLDPGALDNTSCRHFSPTLPCLYGRSYPSGLAVVVTKMRRNPKTGLALPIVVVVSVVAAATTSISWLIHATPPLYSRSGFTPAALPSHYDLALLVIILCLSPDALHESPTSQDHLQEAWSFLSVRQSQTLQERGRLRLRHCHCRPLHNIQRPDKFISEVKHLSCRFNKGHRKMDTNSNDDPDFTRFQEAWSSPAPSDKCKLANQVPPSFNKAY